MNSLEYIVSLLETQNRSKEKTTQLCKDLQSLPPEKREATMCHAILKDPEINPELLSYLLEEHAQMKAKAINNKILIWNMEKGERLTKGGIVLTDDNRKSEGVRPRWAQIYAIGPDVHDDELAPGKWVLVEHGRWTRGMTILNSDGEEVTLWGVEWPDPFIMVADECPVEFAARYS